MLTLQELKNMKERTIFATGTTIDSPAGINMSNSGRELRWVACRGKTHDWAIYINFSDHTPHWIHDHGDKIHNRNHIKKLVPCDDEVLAMYRD